MEENKEKFAVAWEDIVAVAVAHKVTEADATLDQQVMDICRKLADTSIQAMLQEGVGSSYLPLMAKTKFKLVTQKGMDCRLFEVKAVRKRDVVIRALPFFATRNPLPPQDTPQELKDKVLAPLAAHDAISNCNLESENPNFAAAPPPTAVGAAQSDTPED